MSPGRRMEQLVEKLRARTNHAGMPLPGYKQNVAAIQAEMAILQEQIDGAAEHGRK